MNKDVYFCSRCPITIREYTPLTAENPLGYKETVVHINEIFFKNGLSITKKEYNQFLDKIIESREGENNERKV